MHSVAERVEVRSESELPAMNPQCSFCGEGHEDVEKLISNPNWVPIKVYICDQCIEICIDILNDELEKSRRLPSVWEIAMFCEVL